MSWGSDEVCFKGKLNKKRKRKFTKNNEESMEQDDETVGEKKPSPPATEEPKKKVQFDKNVDFKEKKETAKEKRAKIIDEVSKGLNSTKSKRQLKREKNEARLSAMKNEKDKVLLFDVLNYLSKWQHNRDEWKFEKKKNFYIFHNILNEDKIPDKVWNVVLEYVNNSKGSIREKTIKAATDVIESVENESNTSEIDDKKYKRARTLLQHMK